ncbi:hypothetical protein HDG40_006460 [Paraburkholderia sp. JPY158]|uniref:Uncharacterized protein n=1 Tax=Paraburkholderia atlantica TaxID=2654982 RepID=A0A7W8V9X1_PARAM|nr:hypothetical protein [Paraburkholderia atlantica]
MADYEVELREALVGTVGRRATVAAYPRWSASVWDLVARAVAAALNEGAEELPARPAEFDVPVYDDGRKYINVHEIPEPARTIFARKIEYSSVPHSGCAYAHDWLDFLAGNR